MRTFWGYGSKAAAAKLPVFVKEDIFAGAEPAYQEQKSEKGIDFKLINASLNPTNIPGDKFKTAGFEAIKFWFENQTRK